jgi:hypothetical protein
LVPVSAPPCPVSTIRGLARLSTPL